MMWHKKENKYISDEKVEKPYDPEARGYQPFKSKGTVDRTNPPGKKQTDSKTTKDSNQIDESNNQKKC